MNGSWHSFLAGVRPLAILVAAGTALACAPNSRPDPVSVETSRTQCTEPRPQICTREHLPVCGTRVDGSEWTYENSCSACGHSTVLRHRPGEC